MDSFGKTSSRQKCWSGAGASFPFSRWPRRRWPSCHRIPSRCICHLLRCHSSGPRTTPSTVEVENRAVNSHLFLFTCGSWYSLNPRVRWGYTKWRSFGCVFAYLEYAGPIWSPPCIQQIVLPCAHKPFTCKHTADVLIQSRPSQLESFLIGTNYSTTITDFEWTAPNSANECKLLLLSY